MKPFHNGRCGLSVVVFYALFLDRVLLISSRSRNCTKHNCRCDYMDGPRPRDRRARSPSGPELLWSPAIKRDIETWRRTEQFPFPEMHLEPQPLVQNYSLTDLRLMHHIASVSRDMQLRGSSSFVIWTDKIPTYEPCSINTWVASRVYMANQYAGSFESQHLFPLSCTPSSPSRPRIWHG